MLDQFGCHNVDQNQPNNQDRYPQFLLPLLLRAPEKPLNAICSDREATSRSLYSWCRPWSTVRLARIPVKEFKTAAALASHRALAHGYRHQVRKYVKDGWCPSCGFFFHTRLRTLNHLQRSNRICRERVLAGEFPELTVEESREADAAEQAWRVHVRQTGVSLLSGPPCVRPLPPPILAP